MWGSRSEKLISRQLDNYNTWLRFELVLSFVRTIQFVLAFIYLFIYFIYLLLYGLVAHNFLYLTYFFLFIALWEQGGSKFHCSHLLQWQSTILNLIKNVHTLTPKTALQRGSSVHTHIKIQKTMKSWSALRLCNKHLAAPVEPPWLHHKGRRTTLPSPPLNCSPFRFASFTLKLFGCSGLSCSCLRLAWEQLCTKRRPGGQQDHVRGG